MFVADKAAALREAYRVLAPGGQLLLNTWDDIQQNDFCNVAHDTEMMFFETDPPKFYEIPFSLHDADFLKRTIEESGFRNVTVRPLNLPSTSPTAAEAAKGLVQGTPLAVAIKERDADVEAITEAVAKALRTRFHDHPVRGRMCALICQAFR